MANNSGIDRPPGVFGAHKNRMAPIFLTLTLTTAFVLSPALAQGAGLSGKQVVDSVCGACHATGENNAPKIGDEQAWGPRAAQGLSSLTLHALEGIRNMPAHGGHPELSDLEIARAVTYMVNQSGGHWVEPASAADLAAERSGEQVVQAQCVKCHGEGVEGAPKIGDLQAWVQRMKHGLPYLVSSAIRGHGGMPPRGGLANLTDAELRSAILYMYNPAGVPGEASSTAAKPVAYKDPNHQTVGGIDVYLGFIPASNIRALPESAPERTMHGGIPEAPGYYHINASLYDAKTRTPIHGAQIQMQFGSPGLVGTVMTLEPMSLAGSYGNYVKPQPGSPYLIGLSIKKPGESGTIEARFEHTFE
jgi:cytochrome c5